MGHNVYQATENMTETDPNCHNLLQAPLTEDNVVSFSGKVLSSLFALGKELCHQKFELRVDNVRFVGYGVSLEFEVCMSTG